MYNDETETVREGRDGSRDVIYRVTFENGQVAGRKVVRSSVPRQPVTTMVRSAPSTARARRSRPDDELRRRQQRLGQDRRLRVRRQLGREHRQRLLRRPPVQPRHLAVPTAAPAAPTSNSREAQIAVAERVRAAEGGYGAWPVCGR